MFEHRDVRVRRGRRSASIAGQSNEHDVRSTTATGAMVFGYFLPYQKVARSPLRRAKSGENVSCSQRAEPLLARRAENDMNVKAARRAPNER